MKIGTVEIGPDQPCRVVAEISNNHNGSLERAFRLINAAQVAGADFVKFQAYTPDELVALRGDGPAPEPWGSQGWTMRRLYEKAQTPLWWFPLLALHCRTIGMPWFSSVFGQESLEMLEMCGCPAYKIARLDNQHADLIAAARSLGKPIIVSMSGEEKYPIAIDDNTAVLYCPPGYPQQDFKFREGEFDGFSFHGTDPFPCLIAATLGAKIIEAHFQLADEPSELEANVSLTQHQFRQLVCDVRRMEAMLA